MNKDNILNKPRIDGYQMPAEFEDHEATLMIWPYRRDIWREDAKPAAKVFAEIAGVIAQYETVIMCVPREELETAVAFLPTKVQIWVMESDDAWMRDVGPIFVQHADGDVRGIDFGFNAWGGEVDGLYTSYTRDNEIAKYVCRKLHRKWYCKRDFILEGGSIHVDGQGTAIVTKACLLSKGRNPDLSQEEIEEILRDYFNLEKIIWLPHGIYQDETNEHVDNICTFVKPGEVVLGWTDDSDHIQHVYCKTSLKVLEDAVDARGRMLIIHKLPLPKAMTLSDEESSGIIEAKGTKYKRKGDLLAGSYINYYVCNHAVIMPGFGDEMDKRAKEIIESLYPDRNVIQVQTREVLLSGGNIHCITKQIPKQKARTTILNESEILL